MVWIGTEDWSVTTLVSGIPGIHTIGTVLGISIKYTAITGFEEFESHAVPKLLSGTSNGTMDLSVECLQNTDLSSMAAENFSLGDYDIKSSYNVYKAVYAVAHALHQALGCGLDECQKSEVLPWQEVPPSICSPECPKGHRKLQTGQHKCCFDCLACAAHNFLNKTGSTRCQKCELYQWSPAESEVCLDRTVLVLAWGGPLSIALLLLLALTLLITLGTGVIFLLNLGTPVVKSAGGHTCLVMLLALTAAAASALCHFGLPSQTDCLLKQPLFVFSFTVCLACVTVRSFQVLFKALLFKCVFTGGN
uniref:G-protein coupled receptors family 3 profile domain-containing protein n=1 Tax=Oncorhynchus tshawytscha TaxID=74940 RepID=A0A8C8JF75_ONCTS